MASTRPWPIEASFGFLLSPSSRCRQTSELDEAGAFDTEVLRGLGLRSRDSRHGRRSALPSMTLPATPQRAISIIACSSFIAPWHAVSRQPLPDSACSPPIPALQRSPAVARGVTRVGASAEIRRPSRPEGKPSTSVPSSHDFRMAPSQYLHERPRHIAVRMPSTS